MKFAVPKNRRHPTGAGQAELRLAEPSNRRPENNPNPNAIPIIPIPFDRVSLVVISAM